MRGLRSALRVLSGGRLGSVRSIPFQQTLRARMARAGITEYPWCHYDDEVAARRAIKVVDDYTMVSYERLVTLWQQVRYLDRAKVAGCLVECGTWKGGACGMMALAHLANGTPVRPLYLFDSFEGLPEPDGAHDGEVAVGYARGIASATLRSIGHCTSSVEEPQRLLKELIGYPQALTHYHVGWFQNTVPVAAPTIGPIALLRLDGDWYHSTKLCLEQLYPKVSAGGVVVVDDYGRWPGCRKAVDEFLERLTRPVLLHYIDAAARYWVVPGGL